MRNASPCERGTDALLRRTRAHSELLRVRLHDYSHPVTHEWTRPSDRAPAEVLARALSGGPVTAEVVAALEAVDTASASAEQHLALPRAWQRVAAWAEAASLSAVVAFSDATAVEPDTIAADATGALEVGWLCGGGEWVGVGRIQFARALSTSGRLCGLGAAVRSGDLPMHYARRVHEDTLRLSDEACEVVQRRMLASFAARRGHLDAGGRLAPMWRSWRDGLHRAVMRADVDRAARERAEATRDRGAWIRRHRDGTATIACTLPVVDAAGVWQTLTSAAESARADDGEQPRTLDQARADAFSGAFADLLERQGADGSLPAPQGRTRVTVQVQVDLTTLLGLAENPGEVVGHGPIDPELARILASDAQWRRFVTDPLTADLLDAGRDTYAPSRALRDFVIARHPGCTMPGCSRRAWHAQLDHLEPWPNGPTTRDNLHPVCQRDHNRKTHEGWLVERRPDGRISWHSPHGLRLCDEQREPPDAQGSQPPHALPAHPPDCLQVHPPF